MTKSLIYFILFFGIIGQCIGQTDSIKGKVFVSPNFKGEGIAVKWISSNIYFEEGNNVYRKKAPNDWVKLNGSPVRLLTNSPSNVTLDEKSQTLYDYAKGVTHADLQQDFMRAFIVMRAINDPLLAEHLGMTYYDLTAVNNQEYQYKVTGLLNGKEIELSTSSSISVNGYVSPLAPKEVFIERDTVYANFKWQPESERYYGVDIYRRAKGEDEFIKVNIEPFSAQKIEKDGEYIYPEVLYTDSIGNELDYTYKLKAVDYFGQSSDFTNEIEVPIVDLIPPAVPLNFRANTFPLELKIQLEWEANEEEDLAGFDIYKSKSLEEEFVKINDSPIKKNKLSYEDNVAAAGFYYYKVVALDNSGNEATSPTIMSEIKDMLPPSAPVNLVSIPDSGKIVLKWDANQEGDLAGYVIQKSINDDNNLDNYYVNVNTDLIVETEYAEKLAKNIRNKFVYRIIAVDTNYNRSSPSINSLAQMPDVEAPRVPVISNVKSENDNIIISWVPNVDEDLNGYHLYKKMKGDSGEYEKVNINVIRKPIVAYTDRNVEGGKEYEYAVVAEDNSGNVSKLSEKYSFKLIKAQEDGKIVFTTNKLNKNKKQVELQWDNKNENMEMRGYVVYKSDHTGTLKPVTGLSEDKKFKDKIEKNKLTKYQVRGYAATGQVIPTEILEYELIIED